ncbi:MAG: serine hydrolase [Planctomycetota bacterium]
MTITVRKVLLFSTCYLLLFTSPALAQTWVVQFDLTSAQLQANHDDLVPLGYRPVTLSAHDPGSGPRYQATWANDGVSDWAWTHGVTSVDYGIFSAAQTLLNRRPVCVTAHGSYPNELYAAVWINDGVTQWAAQRQLSNADYQTQLTAMTGSGFRPYWVSATGIGANTKYAALWIGDGRTKCEQHNVNSSQFAETVTNYRFGGCRLLCSSGSGTSANPIFAGVWLFWEHPPWESFHGQTLAQAQVTTSQYLSLGFRPSFVNAYETTGGTRYTSAWEEIPKPNLFTMTGQTVPQLTTFDTTMQSFMTARHVPNGTLAVTKNSRLVLARGYTNAPAGWPISKPNAPFRLASLTKTLTAIGVMKLVENGTIGIDQPLSTILDTSAWVDPRISTVTVRHLLQHWGGWNNIAYDPMYYDFPISTALGVPLPTTPQTIFNYMATQPLNFNPGSQFYYSIFGYCLLGMVIESATGQPYEQWMRSNLFLPVQARSIHTADVLLGQQYPGEPPYWDSYQRSSLGVMGPGTPTITPIQYGGWNIRSLESTAGQVASAIDYARVITAFDNPSASPILTQATIELMWSKPPGAPSNATSWYGAGWLVQPLGQTGLIRASGTGQTNGTTTWFMRRPDGVNWVAMFNSNGAAGVPSMSDLGIAIDSVADSIGSWPTNDLFPNYGPLDVTTLVNVMLGIDADPFHVEMSDANFDNAVDARDIAPYLRQALP